MYLSAARLQRKSPAGEEMTSREGPIETSASRHSPESQSQILREPSALLEARYRPSGEKAREET